MGDEILIAKKKEFNKMKFSVCDKKTNQWTPKRYMKIIPNKDFNLLAFLFYDLDCMGYNVTRAFQKFKDLKKEPDLFFL